MKFLAIFAILLIMAVTLFAAAIEENAGEKDGADVQERAGRSILDQITDGVNWVMNKLG